MGKDKTTENQRASSTGTWNQEWVVCSRRLCWICPLRAAHKDAAIWKKWGVSYAAIAEAAATPGTRHGAAGTGIGICGRTQAAALLAIPKQGGIFVLVRALYLQEQWVEHYICWYSNYDTLNISELQLEYCTRMHCIRMWGARFQDGLYIFSYTKHIAR